LAIILVIAVPRILDVIEEARKESLGRSAQMVANYLQKDSAIKMLSSTFPVTNSTPVDCPEESGWPEGGTDGGCTYTVEVTGTEASFTVTIVGAGKFAGWTAVSENGKTPEIGKTVIIPY
ncbi:MAG: hypothetical protein PHR09_01480, partial [Bacilli bacterium]|nr:hypothetical protein [Bacilli bacterium]